MLVSKKLIPFFRHHHHHGSRFLWNLNNALIHKTLFQHRPKHVSKKFYSLFAKIILHDGHNYGGGKHQVKNKKFSSFMMDKFIPTTQNGLVQVSKEVYDAIQTQENNAASGVVALESTIITHGMKYPANLETALKVESIIRNNGAIPATIGILDGKIYIGLQPDQLESLAKKGHNQDRIVGQPQRQHQKQKIYKVSSGDLPAICQWKCNGGTTVSATAFLANQAGIRVFVTGGIGGVHRGAEITMDISSDLNELGRTPITVVCAGIKSILDIEKTLEVLETKGVCVATFNVRSKSEDGLRTEFPAFYTPTSGLFVNYNFEDTRSVAQLIQIRDELRLSSAILLAVPNYVQPTSTKESQKQRQPENDIEESNSYQKQLDIALQQALSEACRLNIKGKDVTPFLLSRISVLTNEQALRLNQNLIENNARVGAQIAVDYNRMKLKQDPSTQHSGIVENVKKFHSSRKLSIESKESNKTSPYPVILGGSIWDIITKIHQNQVELNGSTYNGSIYAHLGGVARNISDCIMRLGQHCQLITAVGDDQQGRLVAQNNSNMVQGGIRFMPGMPTSTSIVSLDNDGQCILVVADLRIHQFIDREFISQFESNISQAPIVIIDANLSKDSIDYVCGLCLQHHVPVWYEPTDSSLAQRLIEINPDKFEAIKFISPNFNELQAIYNLAASNPTPNIFQKDLLSSEQIVEICKNYGLELLRIFPNLHSILVTIDKNGIVYIGPENDLESKGILNPNLFHRHHPNEKLDQAIHLAQENGTSVLNVSGAGDCLVGAVIYGSLHGMTLRESLQLGLKAAKHCVSSSQTVPLDLDKILR